MSSEPKGCTVTYFSNIPEKATIFDHWNVLINRLDRPRNTIYTEQDRRDSMLACEFWKRFASECEGLTCIIFVFAHHRSSSPVDIGVFKGMVGVAQERIDRYRVHWPTSVHFCVILRDLCFAFIDSFEGIFVDIFQYLQDDEAPLTKQLGDLHSSAKEITMHAHKTLEVIQGFCNNCPL